MIQNRKGRNGSIKRAGNTGGGAESEFSHGGQKESLAKDRWTDLQVAVLLSLKVSFNKMGRWGVRRNCGGQLAGAVWFGRH